MLLDALESGNTVGVAVTAEAHLGRRLIPQEGDAVRRAARHLARLGFDLHHVTQADGTGPNRGRLVITRPGAVITPRRQRQLQQAAASTDQPAYPPVDQAAESRKLIRQLQRVVHTSQLLPPEVLGGATATQLSAVIAAATRQLSDIQQGRSTNAHVAQPTDR